MRRAPVFHLVLSTIVVLSILTGIGVFVSQRRNTTGDTPPELALTHDASPETIGAAWRQATIENRGDYLDDILCQTWELNAPIDPRPTLIARMTQTEATRFLGSPDDISDHSISYELKHMRESSLVRDSFSEAVMGDTPHDDLIIYFDENTGIVSGIWIGS